MAQATPSCQGELIPCAPRSIVLWKESVWGAQNGGHWNVCKLPKMASVCQRGAKVGTTLLVVAGRQPRGCREEEREIFHFPFLRREVGGWFGISALLQKSPRFCFKGIKVKNLKSRKKRFGFLIQQNVSAGLKWKGFQHVASGRNSGNFINSCQPAANPTPLSSCLQMTAHKKKSISSQFSCLWALNSLPLNTLTIIRRGNGNETRIKTLSPDCKIIKWAFNQDHHFPPFLFIC